MNDNDLDDTFMTAALCTNLQAPVSGVNKAAVLVQYLQTNKMKLKLMSNYKPDANAQKRQHINNCLISGQ